MQQLVRRERFPIYGNLCLIQVLKELGMEVQVNFQKGEATAIFGLNQVEQHECLKRILDRHNVVASA